MILVLCGIALAIGVLVWLHYLKLIPEERVPKRPWLHILGILVSLVMMALSVVQYVAEGDPAIPGPAVALWILISFLDGLFIFLLFQARLPRGQLAVEVGGSLIPFTAQDQDGQAFDSASLRGQRTLLKFFRGHW